MFAGDLGWPSCLVYFCICKMKLAISWYLSLLEQNGKKSGPVEALGLLFYPLYECTYGRYYGLVVVTPCPPPHPPPRPQTFHRSHDNLKNPYRIASTFYMLIHIGERIAGKQDGLGPIIYGPPRAPRITQNAHFCILWPIYEKLAIICSACYTYVCSVKRSYFPEIFVHLGST